MGRGRVRAGRDPERGGARHRAAAGVRHPTGVSGLEPQRSWPSVAVQRYVGGPSGSARPRRARAQLLLEPGLFMNAKKGETNGAETVGSIKLETERRGGRRRRATVPAPASTSASRPTGWTHVANVLRLRPAPAPLPQPRRRGGYYVQRRVKNGFSANPEVPRASARSSGSDTQRTTLTVGYRYYSTTRRVGTILPLQRASACTLDDHDFFYRWYARFRRTRSPRRIPARNAVPGRFLPFPAPEPAAGAERTHRPGALATARNSRGGGGPPRVRHRAVARRRARTARRVPGSVRRTFCTRAQNDELVRMAARLSHTTAAIARRARQHHGGGSVWKTPTRGGPRDARLNAGRLSGPRPARSRD